MRSKTKLYVDKTAWVAFRPSDLLAQVFVGFFIMLIFEPTDNDDISKIFSI